MRQELVGRLRVDPFKDLEIAQPFADFGQELVWSDAGELEELEVEEAFATIDVDAGALVYSGAGLVDESWKVGESAQTYAWAAWRLLC